MNSVKLKLNPGKTEFIVFGSEAMLDKIKHCFPVDIQGQPSNSCANTQH
jgi:hypothetical protein